MKTLLMVLLIAIISMSSAHAVTVPGGWWQWCETDAYSGTTICAWIRSNPGKGKAIKKGGKK